MAIDNGSAEEPAIEIADLVKVFGRTRAVDHLSLTVQRGEIFGFLGPNGAGKTTTMRILLGLVRPTSGHVRVLGLEIGDQLPAILARTGAIIETPTFYPYLSGRDNLRCLARLTRTPDQRVAEILTLLDLEDSATRPFRSYSLGMKQRLAVGAALLHNPELLILDEPANGLDPAGIVAMRDLMRRLKAEGHTVFISSHALHEIEQMCDRIAILQRGRVVVSGRVADLLGSREALEVRVEPIAEAERVLRATPWIAAVTRDGDCLLVSAPESRAGEVTRILAERGLYVSGVRPRERKLEQYFLDVMGEGR
ncbi:MAG: ABC transporter ATP-binding protein [Chloroflexota bacterium]|nr:ABC transporter ATP-binding protein [Chloroflexota bacterium]